MEIYLTEDEIVEANNTVMFSKYLTLEEQNLALIFIKGFKSGVLFANKNSQNIDKIKVKL